jgi:phage-related protein
MNVPPAGDKDKPLLWLRGEVKTPPFSTNARLETGVLLRRLQAGDTLTLPQSRPMPLIGKRCYELRIRDRGHNWRLVYRVDADAIVIADVFDKKTPQTPPSVINQCRLRLDQYDRVAKKGKRG